MLMFDKLLKGYKGTKENPKEESSDVLEEYKKRLKDVLYDDDLIEEYAPLFAKIHEHDQDGKLVGLLEAKEQQLNAIADGSAFKQSSPEEEQDVTSNEEEESSNDDYSVEALIQNRGK